MVGIGDPRKGRGGCFRSSKSDRLAGPSVWNDRKIKATSIDGESESTTIRRSRFFQPLVCASFSRRPHNLSE